MRPKSGDERTGFLVTCQKLGGVLLRRLAIKLHAFACHRDRDDRGFRRAKPRITEEGPGRMMHPDLHHAIMSIMKYGSLVLALSFAGKIAVFAARHL